jgi:choline dehydrogenase
VTIASNDTSDLPIINPNWLSTEADQQIAIAAYKRIRDMFHSKAMAPIVVGDEYCPGSQYQTDAEILEVIRNTVMTIYHAACTCKMGTKDDPMAVLDSRARVVGVDRLRVVDASAFPILPPGHPQATVCK